MRYTPEIEQKIIEQIARTPDSPIILPDWAYGARDQPQVYVDSMPTELLRHLYTVAVADLPEEWTVRNPPHVDPRNVNPLLAVVLRSRRARAACPNGHVYSDADWVEGVGYRCQTCRLATRERRVTNRPSVADVNRKKRTCPKGHKLVKRKNGKRRCLECPREATRRWREQTKGTK